MGKRRLYELAQDHGLTTAELLRRLEQAGIQGKKPLSTLEEEEVEAALAQTKSGDASDDSSDASQGQRLAPVERLLLWRKLRHLRRLHEAQLKELAGLAVELHRLDSPRYQELAAELFPVWLARNYLSGALLDVDELVRVIDNVLRCGASATIPTVAVVPRPPS